MARPPSQTARWAASTPASPGAAPPRPMLTAVPTRARPIAPPIWRAELFSPAATPRSSAAIACTPPIVEDEPGGEAARCRGGEDAERLGPCPVVDERRGQDRDRGRHRQRGADALDRSRADEEGGVRRSQHRDHPGLCRQRPNDRTARRADRGPAGGAGGSRHHRRRNRSGRHRGLLARSRRRGPPFRLATRAGATAGAGRGLDAQRGRAAAARVGNLGTGTRRRSETGLCPGSVAGLQPRIPQWTRRGRAGSAPQREVGARHPAPGRPLSAGGHPRDLPRINTPTLVVGCTFDHLIPVEHARDGTPG